MKSRSPGCRGGPLAAESVPRAGVRVHTHDAGAVEEDVLRHTRDAELHALVKAGEGEALGRRGQDGPQVTGRIETFAPHATIIHVDIDPAEIGKNKPIDVPIVGDCKVVLTEMLTQVQEQDWQPDPDLASYPPLTTPPTSPADIDAFVGRGGLLRPLTSGTYPINPDMLADLTTNRYGVAETHGVIKINDGIERGHRSVT